LLFLSLCFVLRPAQVLDCRLQRRYRRRDRSPERVCRGRHLCCQCLLLGGLYLGCPLNGAHVDRPDGVDPRRLGFPQCTRVRYVAGHQIADVR
jgi:hypothetical protein